MKLEISSAAPRFTIGITESSARRADLALSVERGLTSSPKHLPPWLFYDDTGSRLFEIITGLPEYYLTRMERRILQKRSKEIAGLFRGPVDMVELGSGSSFKTRLLIEAFIASHGSLRYIPVDISKTMLLESSMALLEAYPGLEVLALNCEYSRALARVAGRTEREKLILWLGSSIGNLEPGEAAVFLRHVRTAMAPPDRLILGVDLRKDRSILHHAYNDSQNVTARFNRNLLVRMNRELGADFSPEDFEHEAIYDELTGAVEMYLVSRKKQRISISGIGREIGFEAGERIHTENSYKYSTAEIKALVHEGGFEIDRQWSDENMWFMLNMLKPCPFSFPT